MSRREDSAPTAQLQWLEDLLDRLWSTVVGILGSLKKIRRR